MKRGKRELFSRKTFNKGLLAVDMKIDLGQLAYFYVL